MSLTLSSLAFSSDGPAPCLHNTSTGPPKDTMPMGNFKKDREQKVADYIHITCCSSGILLMNEALYEFMRIVVGYKHFVAIPAEETGMFELIDSKCERKHRKISWSDVLPYDSISLYVALLIFKQQEVKIQAWENLERRKVELDMKILEGKRPNVSDTAVFILATAIRNITHHSTLKMIDRLTPKKYQFHPQIAGLLSDAQKEGRRIQSHLIVIMVMDIQEKDKNRKPKRQNRARERKDHEKSKRQSHTSSNKKSKSAKVNPG
ncbi:hypothetical protein Tco_0276348 [Tanacetum coccineum]